jgi:hypothetical protein
MPSHKKIMAREAGTAMAVLAIYVLTLLLPLHLSAGLQRDFNALGFSTLAAWSVCAPLAADEDGEPREAAALSCPAIGGGQQQFAALMPPALWIEPAANIVPVRPAHDRGLPAHSLPSHVGQSRAPPVAV